MEGPTVYQLQGKEGVFQGLDLVFLRCPPEPLRPHVSGVIESPSIEISVEAQKGLVRFGSMPLAPKVEYRMKSATFADANAALATLLYHGSSGSSGGVDQLEIRVVAFGQELSKDISIQFP